MSHDLKQYLYCAIVSLFIFPFTGKAQKQPEYVLPTTPFNKEEGYKMLEEGTNSIRGSVSLKKRGWINYPDYSDRVMLYPVTPYLLEYIELKKKYNSKKKQAAMTKEAAVNRIETKVLDDKGSFVFSDIKPGRYYIVSWVTYEKVRSSQVQSGPVIANYNMLGQQMGMGYVPTETRYDATAFEREIGEFVNVAGNGQVITITIAR